ncbi:MAG: hypothetical protein ACYDB9_05350 [Gammaproteobacteria bacterium]
MRSASWVRVYSVREPGPLIQYASTQARVKTGARPAADIENTAPLAPQQIARPSRNDRLDKAPHPRIRMQGFEYHLDAHLVGEMGARQVTRTFLYLAVQAIIKRLAGMAGRMA